MQNFKHKKHLFFDLDHTLWDFDKNSAFAFDTIFKEQGFEISLPDFLNIYIPRNHHYWKLYQVNKISHEDLRYYRLKDVFDALQYEVSDKIIHQLSEDYIKYLPEYNNLFDGAIEILDYLKPNYKLHIITNGFASVQTKKLKNSNIDHYFETITNSEMAGVKKPHRNIFDFALSLANASKNDSLMIGDSYEADIVGAQDAGIEAIFFNEHNSDIENPVLQIKHLLELKNIL
ncbi:YjjG family noncanonical pyrimidine nucleotidase [Flavobacterium celericrescens]|uniref:Noncanonical pyrimidine nucleotidase, YjjG family n=1 Tax=Flavobacterium celericrescens TaxID=2709780 RepID=A0ABX0IEP8_9FLAO|nr:YjjG family noncanonical pyrimidine nucleotidase [Flavobacterium celericrescens]NHM05527.1 noncanonical pyrimidine nucleotidase, YjjG family [Flavobacterium celericrescens]